MFNTISVGLKPETETSLPYSDGHLVYAAILEKLNEYNSNASQTIHDSDIGINISSLDGPFQNIEDKPMKRVFDDGTYTCKICIYNFQDDIIESFMDVIKDMLFSGSTISIGDGEFEIVEASVDNTGIDEIMSRCEEYENPEITFNFKSPTCIRYGTNGVFEIYPHRMGVFGSIRERWNKIVESENQISLTNDRVGINLYEVSIDSNISNHKVITAKYEKNSKKKPVKRRGFTGKCTYRTVNDCPSDVKNALTILSQAAQYIGVGTAVARGCGTVSTNITERQKIE